MTSRIQFKAIASVLDAVAFSSLAPRVVPGKILMCPPTFFEVKDAKNEFMSDNVGGVDFEKAQQQWTDLKTRFEACNFPVELIEPVDGLEDMVFTANQCLPALDDDGKPLIVVGRMAYQSRQREVPYFEKWFQMNGYEKISLSSQCDRFEGGGDAVWHANRNLLWVGVGQRTSAASSDQLSVILKAPIVRLNLVDKKFYHLDTAFSVLDAESVLIYPAAFDDSGLQLIRHYFKNVIEVSLGDANNFACNALALGRNVILQTGSKATCDAVLKLGFTPIEVQTSEFMKSGGSVYCMKQMVY